MVKPRWFLAVVYGLLFGLPFGLLMGLQEHDSVVGLIDGVIGGAFFGPAMTLTLGPIQSGLLASAGSLPPEERLAAVRAASRSPRPTDPPAVITGARRVVEYRLGEVRRQQLAVFGFLGAFILLGLAAAVLESGWWFLVVGFWVIQGVLRLILPSRLRRRLQSYKAVEGGA
ncbi:hypothetical protein GCM10011575_18530 [Microlunatus endophyticus]|uniref:Transmembrane protein n=1 Tax=Microlunatus endophyticus TaxID=1716077 RepID=A0A917S5U7_9ACTN|nr:hypothetical protein [Microlunatus endophyticus]GGL60319.1 hypothetical protein GCM10011575_18530 [Microlunatus endophyticus]